MKMEPSNEIRFQHAQSSMPKDLDHFDIFEEFPKINRFYIQAEDPSLGQLTIPMESFHENFEVGRITRGK